ncbi:MULTISPECIES: hypothetical protein [Actinosynnema]|uniref:amino acid kinase family protein n=1 Tax=Actinosynnema TaxID=40566 RepID=UPI0020A48002|nr:hypothetical protein [Actinosynnema pretiosum]MCP2092327.1 N-acetylglutamate kinase (EC 2.7.2.8)/N2-acetyl-L-aminoadipate kinase (EC 2.7.2.-) [Actinosynnema pretiosum]
MTPVGATPVVVKLGGSCLEDMAGDWWADLAAHARVAPVVLVHGWSKPLKRLRARYRDPSAVLRDRYGNQSRWTTPEVVEDILAVSAGLAVEVADRLRPHGVAVDRVLGRDGLLSAAPGERWYWRDKRLVEIDNLVGPISGVDPAALGGLAPGRVVLVTPLARDERGRTVNTDADRAAAAVAGALGAPALALVTDVPFLLIDGEPVRAISATSARLFRDKHAVGGMRKKLRAADEGLAGGVERVVIGSAPLSELLAGATGTVITPDEPAGLVAAAAETSA